MLIYGQNVKNKQMITCFCIICNRVNINAEMDFIFQKDDFRFEIALPTCSKSEI